MDKNSNHLLLVNEKIRAREVRLIGKNGENLGIVSIREALSLASDVGLDLIEISPSVNPPVCKIMDYGKWKYEEQKKQSEIRKSQKIIETKELKMRPNIDVHDFQIKIKAAKKFLSDGNNVKFSIKFKGRELSNRDAGMALLEKVKSELGTLVKIDKEPSMEGKQMIMVVVATK